MSDQFATGGFRRPSWHGKEDLDWAAGIFSGDPTIREVMADANMLYEVQRKQAGFKIDDRQWIADPNRWKLVRPPVAWENEWVPLREVGNRYQPIQNGFLAEVLQPLTGDWPLEGTAVLYNGAVIFVQLKMDGFRVGGLDQERHEGYLLVFNDHRKGSLGYLETFVRVVCANTYGMAMGSNTNLSRVSHTGNPEMELKFRRDLYQWAQRAQKEEHAFMERLFKTPADKSDMADFLEAVFPMPGKPKSVKNVEAIPDTMEETEAVVAMREKGEKALAAHENAVQRVRDRRALTAAATARFNDDSDNGGRGTWYALWNGFTDFMSNGDETFRGDDLDRLVSQLFLGGSKEKIMRRGRQSIEKLVEAK